MKLSLHNFISCHNPWFSSGSYRYTHLFENEVETFGVSNHETNSFNNSQNLLLPYQKSCPRHFILCVNSMVPMWRNNVMIRLISVSLHVWEILVCFVRPVVVSMRYCMLCRGEKGHWSAPWWGGKYALPYSATILPVSNTLFIVLHRRNLSDVRCVGNLSKHWNIWTDHHQLGFWRASWKRIGCKINGACCHIVIG